MVVAVKVLDEADVLSSKIPSHNIAEYAFRRMVADEAHAIKSVHPNNFQTVITLYCPHFQLHTFLHRDSIR